MTPTLRHPGPVTATSVGGARGSARGGPRWISPAGVCRHIIPFPRPQGHPGCPGPPPLRSGLNAAPTAKVTAVGYRSTAVGGPQPSRPQWGPQRNQRLVSRNESPGVRGPERRRTCSWGGGGGWSIAVKSDTSAITTLHKALQSDPRDRRAALSLTPDKKKTAGLRNPRTSAERRPARNRRVTAVGHRPTGVGWPSTAGGQPNAATQYHRP